MNYKKLAQEDRDKILKSQLSEKIVKILDRYKLISTPDLKWISKKENSHEQVFFTHKFLMNNDELSVLFRANYMCYAKLAYYRENIRKYEPAKYEPNKGFIKTEWYDADFLKHKASEQYIDFRFLQRITDPDVFKEFCAKLETIEKNSKN